MIAASIKMATTGVAGKRLHVGADSDPDSARYALANLAAFLAQSMQETIQYDGRALPDLARASAKLV
jgi:hypothetical protein